MVGALRGLPRRRCGQEGTSLLELVVGLGILVMALLPLVSSLATASRGLSLSRHRSEAADLLVLAAEETRVGLAEGTIPEPSVPVTERLEQYAGTGFVLARTLEPVVGAGERMVRVRLSLELGGRQMVEAVFLCYRRAL